MRRWRGGFDTDACTCARSVAHAQTDPQPDAIAYTVTNANTRSDAGTDAISDTDPVGWVQQRGPGSPDQDTNAIGRDQRRRCDGDR